MQKEKKKKKTTTLHLPTAVFKSFLWALDSWVWQLSGGLQRCCTCLAANPTEEEMICTLLVPPSVLRWSSPNPIFPLYVVFGLHMWFTCSHSRCKLVENLCCHVFSSIFSQLVFQISTFSFSKYNSVFIFSLAKLDLGLFISSFFGVCLFLFLHQSHDREETAGRQKTKVLTIIATVDFPALLSSDTVICLTNAIFFLSVSL